jgi:hypothetical protein
VRRFLRVMAAGRDRLERALPTLAACCGWVGRVAVDLEVLARALRLAAELALMAWVALDLWTVAGGRLGRRRTRATMLSLGWFVSGGFCLATLSRRRRSVRALGGRMSVVRDWEKETLGSVGGAVGGAVVGVGAARL